MRTIGCGNRIAASYLPLPGRAVVTKSPMAARIPVVTKSAANAPVTQYVPVLPGGAYNSYALAPGYQTNANVILDNVRVPVPLTPLEVASQQQNYANYAQELANQQAQDASSQQAALAPSDDGTDSGVVAPGVAPYIAPGSDIPWIPITLGAVLLTGGIWWFTSGSKKKKK